MLFVWNDPEGNPPPEDVTIPRIPAYGDPEFTEWVWYTTKIDGSNCREIVDNVVDMAHFFYVHYSFPTYFKNVFEGHVATQYMEGIGREDIRPQRKGQTGVPQSTGNSSVASYHGPSFMIDDLTYHYDDGVDIPSVLINCHYPVDADSFVLQYGDHGQEDARPQRRGGDRDGPEDGRLHPHRLRAGRRRSGRARPGSTTRCCARRTGRSTSSAAGTSSSTSTSRT